MPYYPTLAEDVARAKQILARGKSEIDELLDHLPEDLRAEMMQPSGGTIYGGDTYAAYKLLESFVEVIEKRTRVQGHCGSCGGINFTVVETCDNCGESEQLEHLTGTAADDECVCRTRGCGHTARLHVGGICQACKCEGWR